MFPTADLARILGYPAQEIAGARLTLLERGIVVGTQGDRTWLYGDEDVDQLLEILEGSSCGSS
jgi:hypothetical protein